MAWEVIADYQGREVRHEFSRLKGAEAHFEIYKSKPDTFSVTIVHYDRHGGDKVVKHWEAAA